MKKLKYQESTADVLNNFWMGLVENWCWVRELLKRLYLKNELMNWTDFLHGDSDGVISIQTSDLTLQLLLLNTGGPLQICSFDAFSLA